MCNGRGVTCHGAVAVIDDEPTYRLGLTSALAGFGFKVEDNPADPLLWTRGPGRRSLIVSERPTSNLEVVVQGRSRSDSVAVVILDQVTPEAAAGALLRGADGVAARSARPERIVDALLAANQGKIVLPTAVAHSLAVSSRLTTPPPDLGADERDFLQLVAQGFRMSEIASQLAYSERTLYRLQQQLYRRLGVKNRMEALAQALRFGLLERAPLSEVVS